MSSSKLPNINQLSDLAAEIYSNIPKDEIEAHQGQFIAIELDSKEHFFGDTKDDAVASAKSAHAGKIVFIRRVGNIEKIQTYAHKTNLQNSRVQRAYAGIF